MPQASAPSVLHWQAAPRGQVHGRGRSNKNGTGAAAATMNSRQYDSDVAGNRPDFNTSWPLEAVRSQSPRSSRSRSRSRGDDDGRSRGSFRDTAGSDDNGLYASQPMAPSSARQSSFAPRVAGLSSPLRTQRDLSQLDGQGSEHFGTGTVTQLPLFDDAFNATSILEAGSITKNNWNINYSIRRVYNGCFSMDVSIRESGQKWELFIQNSDASDNALRLWETCPSTCPNHIGVLGSWILGCTRLDFDHNKVNGARFDYASLRQMCTREVGMAVTNAARCIQALARGYIVRNSMRQYRRRHPRRSPTQQRKGYMRSPERSEHQFTLLPQENSSPTYGSQDFNFSARIDDYAMRRAESPRNMASREIARAPSPRASANRPQTGQFRAFTNDNRAKSRAGTARSNKTRDAKSAARKTRSDKPNVELLVMELNSMRNRLEVLQNTVQQQNDFKEMIETKAQRAISRARQEADEMVKKAKSDAIAELIVLFRSAQQNPSANVALTNTLSQPFENTSSRSPSPPPGAKPSKKAPSTDRYLKPQVAEAPAEEVSSNSKGMSQFMLPEASQGSAKPRVNKSLGAAQKTGGSSALKQSQASEAVAITNTSESQSQAVVPEITIIMVAEEKKSIVPAEVARPIETPAVAPVIVPVANASNAAAPVPVPAPYVAPTPAPVVVVTPAPVPIATQAVPAPVVTPVAVAPAPAPAPVVVPEPVIPVLSPLEMALKEIRAPETNIDGPTVLSYLRMAAEKSSSELASLSLLRLRNTLMSSSNDISTLTTDITAILAVTKSFASNSEIIANVLDILVMLGDKSNKQVNGAAGAEFEEIVNALTAAGLTDCMSGILLDHKSVERVSSRAVDTLTSLSLANATCKKDFQTSGFSKALHEVLLGNVDSRSVIQSVSKWIVVACTNSYIAQDNFFAACIIDDMMSYLFNHQRSDPASVLTEICNALIALCAGKHVDNIKLIGLPANCKQFVELIKYLAAQRSPALESVLWTLLNSSAKYPPTRRNFAQLSFGEMLNSMIEDKSSLSIVRQYSLYLVASLVGDEAMHSEFSKTSLPATIRAILSGSNEDAETRKVASMAIKRMDGGPSESHSGRKASVMLPGSISAQDAPSREAPSKHRPKVEQIAEDGEEDGAKASTSRPNSGKEKKHRRHSRENVEGEAKVLTAEEEAAEKERKERHRSRRASRFARAEVTGVPLAEGERPKSGRRHSSSKSRERSKDAAAKDAGAADLAPANADPAAQSTAQPDAAPSDRKPSSSGSSRSASKSEKRSKKADLAVADPKVIEPTPVAAAPTEAAPIAPGVGPFASVSAQGSIDSTSKADPKNQSDSTAAALTPEEKAALEAELKKVKKIHKALKKQLLEWTEAFVKANGREPSVEDKKGDKTIEPVFAQYFKVSKYAKDLQAKVGDTS